VAAIAFLCVIVGSWWYLVGRAREASQLEAQVAALLDREAEVAALARDLEEVETGYEALRHLFGPGAEPGGGGLWLPPAPGRQGGGVPSSRGQDDLPVSWPLTERGFVTQVLLEANAAEAVHPGIDIAIPAGSYIRASGGGMVRDAAEDPVYGNYLVVEHSQGYRSLYAHASMLFAKPGDVVRKNEVIALSGSSGRSTAPHLHFEIQRDGEPVDPLTMVKAP
jgi:murein DD-endopeptidase MepM/ murein hydrolase activator NlpD